MLISFKFSNFESYKNENAFSMLAPRGKIKSRYPENFIDSCGIQALKTAVIVGENAGGKTNFVSAFEYLKDYLFKIHDRPVASLGATVFSDALWGLSGDDAVDPSVQRFELEVIASDDNLYHYVLCIDKKGIIEESLSFRKTFKALPQLVFRVLRHEDESKETFGYDITVKSGESLPKGFSKTLSDEEKASNGLFVNKLALLDVDNVSPFVNWVNDTLVVRRAKIPLNLLYSIDFERGNLKAAVEVLKTPEFLEIFRLVDPSITAIDVSEESPFEKTKIIRKCGESSYQIDIENDSAGVQQFFALSLEIHRVIHQRKVVFADELDSTLNPVLTAKVIQFIHSFDDCGQFVFTTHNVTHLNFRYFVKEQMNIVSKSKETLESRIQDLSCFSDLRYDGNERLYEYYLKGLLGGVPDE